MDMHTSIGGSTKSGVREDKLILSLKPYTNNAAQKYIRSRRTNSNDNQNII